MFLSGACYYVATTLIFSNFSPLTLFQKVNYFQLRVTGFKEGKEICSDGKFTEDCQPLTSSDLF